eukprot:m51a1_g8086 hypothetical protein (527) ;mRNA; r:36628-38940
MRLLIRFAHKFIAFRLPELESLAQLFGIPVTWSADDARRLNSIDPNEETVYLWVEIPSIEAAQQIASRAILIRGFYDVWGEGETYEEMVADAKARWPAERVAQYADPRGIKVAVCPFGSRHSSSETIARLERTSELPVWNTGPVNLKSPAQKYAILEYYGADREKLLHVYFARRVAKGARGLVERFSLKRREYLGTTSMNAELSLLMANQALVCPGSLVYDPFAGTGSLVLACAQFGAMGLGSDISGNVLRGLEGPAAAKAKAGAGGAAVEQQRMPNVRSNFAQYGLEGRLLDLLVLDHSRRPLRSCELLDAIVCDPPYGVRAGARKVGKKEKSTRKGSRAPEGATKHISQCVNYDVPEMLVDLLDSAAENIAVGGRLVFWLPTTVDYSDEDLPTHPCFRLVSNSLQQITLSWGRRLVTMQKVCAYDPAAHAAACRSASPAHKEFGNFVLHRGGAMPEPCAGQLRADDGSGLAEQLRYKKEKKTRLDEHRFEAINAYHRRVAEQQQQQAGTADSSAAAAHETAPAQ